MTESNVSCHKFWSKAALTHHCKVMGPLEDSMTQPPVGAKFFLGYKPILRKLATQYSCDCLPQSS